MKSKIITQIIPILSSYTHTHTYTHTTHTLTHTQHTHTLTHTKGYEEGEEEVSKALACGYPRFVYHPYILTLMDHAIEVYCKKEGTEKVGEHVSRTDV